jgi:hypothetical protein
VSNIIFEANGRKSKLKRLLELFLLFAFAVYCPFKFGQFQYWHLTLYTGHGAELKDVKVEYLDRNNNGKPDTLKFTYKLVSDTPMIGFGGTEICIGDQFRSFSCKNIHSYYPDPQTDTSGHELICSGENTYVRYLYFNSVPYLTFGNSMMTLNIIGSEAGIFHRGYVFPNKLDLSNFEALTIGKEVDHYPNYVDATSPIENKTIQIKDSCRCRFDGCSNTNDIQLNTNQKYPAGLF